MAETGFWASTLHQSSDFSLKTRFLAGFIDNAAFELQVKLHERSPPAPTKE